MRPTWSIFAFLPMSSGAKFDERCISAGLQRNKWKKYKNIPMFERQIVNYMFRLKLVIYFIDINGGQKCTMKNIKIKIQKVWCEYTKWNIRSILEIFIQMNYFKSKILFLTSTELKLISVLSLKLGNVTKITKYYL